VLRVQLTKVFQVQLIRMFNDNFYANPFRKKIFFELSFEN